MPVYEFRCERCGGFDAPHPMASVPAEDPCPCCERPARRVFSSLGLSRLGGARARAIGVAEQSASQPQVVTGSPGRTRATPTTHDPRHKKLPRP